MAENINKDSIIDEEELENVSGGTEVKGGEGVFNCPKCQKKQPCIFYSGGRGKCKVCGTMGPA